MNTMKQIAKTVAVAGLLVGLPLSLAPAENIGASGSGAIVVELFTSQSCFSCPPAEAFLGELIESGDILALEWHVDYWDDLVDGSAGRWKDVFSDPAFTARQRDYNQAIRGVRNVYTPQMIVGGREQAVGSRREDVHDAIAKVRAEGFAVDVAIETADDGLHISVSGDHPGAAAIWLVNFDLEQTTEVLRGENRGKTLVNHSVVRTAQRIGDWSGSATTIDAADIRTTGQGCAVLVQTETLGPLLGAAACPATIGS